MHDQTSEWLAPQSIDCARTLPARCYGDHAVGEAGGVPILAVRGADGVLRALHNVCRHRAGPLAACDGRAARALVCKYHGWTYALDGALRGAPEMDAAARAAGAIRLPAARVAEWQGLVFVALGTAPPFEELVRGIDAHIGAHRLADDEFDRRVVYEVAYNWKVYVDNFLEGYHLRHVHPGLARARRAPLSHRSRRLARAAVESARRRAGALRRGRRGRRSAVLVAVAEHDAQRASGAAADPSRDPARSAALPGRIR
jgi:phenylpropionate dioxygenase-like ring-hydroxylating dioxygenase large terminal subunit